jgi:hypothetical protein
MRAPRKVAVCTGDRLALSEAAELLRQRGIESWHGRPKREGLLRVVEADVARTRALLAAHPNARFCVIEAGAPWFNCHRCAAELAGGETYCPRCGAFVRD